ncbi:transcriptional regulator [Methanobrevibacter sp.]|uniref:transcriptional regulator n=1 Tax=Methanobrevibacter sp. TaxID=66852 RepID=UPI00386AE687
MVRDEILIVGEYVKISGKRLDVIETLKPGEVKIPKQIATDTGIRVNHISKVLGELKNKELVVCINEEVRKGRLYRLTPLGEEVREYVIAKE